MGASKSNSNKTKVTVAPLPNNNTFILLSDNHGPQKIQANSNPIQQYPSNKQTPYQKDYKKKRRNRIAN